MIEEPHYLIMYKNGYAHLVCEMTKSEERIMAFILDNVKFGNIAYLPQVEICEALNMYKSNVSVSIKHIKDLDILRKYRRGFMLNPRLFVIGPTADRPKLTAMYDKLGKKEEVAHAEDN